MRKIASADNRIFKVFSRLQMRKYRDREGQYIIEGENLYREALLNGAQVKLTAVREDKLDYYKALFGVAIDDAYVLDEKLFSKLALTETSQGIAGIVEKPAEDDDFHVDGNILVLDRLQDPGNIGTIIRTCDAAGYGAVLAVKGTADIYSPKVVRSAAGSLFRVKIIDGIDTENAIELLRSMGKKITGTCFDTENYYYDIDMTDNIALVIGNEGNGMSEEFLNACDMKIKIPMKGSIESLNASVAAGILIYETIRQEKEKCRIS